MNANYPTARLPLYIPHKDGIALRHLLNFDYTGDSTASAHEQDHNRVILAVCISMLVTVVMTAACIFAVWRCHKRLQRADVQCC